MYFLIKILRKFVGIFNSAAAPWQVFLGTLIGVLLGFLPIFPASQGPALLGLGLLVLGLVLNCHLTALLLFFGLGKLLSLGLAGPATALGNACAGLAQTSADIALLRASLWSHTGYLGLTLIGLVLAPLIALAMAWATVQFRTRLRDRLLARRNLVVAGKVGSNPLLVRIACWFFGI